ncbi:MAG: DUF4381 domain-containing protein [Pseudomonadota bacterium]
MDPQTLKQLLQPLREPSPLDWWPPAPGWWVLAFLGLCALVYVCFLLRRRWKRGEALRAAKATVKRLRLEQLEPQDLVARLGVLQRRLSIASCGRASSAGLTGEAWADLLNSLGRKRAGYFDTQSVALAHRPVVTAQESQQFLENTERWLQEFGPDI